MVGYPLSFLQQPSQRRGARGRQCSAAGSQTPDHLDSLPWATESTATATPARPYTQLTKCGCVLVFCSGGADPAMDVITDPIAAAASDHMKACITTLSSLTLPSPLPPFISIST
eukprot:1638866-Rhodomonas_salina.3